MKLWSGVILALLAGFGLGRLTAPSTDPELATLASFQRALDDPDWLTRSYRYSGFLLGLSPENLPEALDAVVPQLPWLTTAELRVFMLAWARFDAPGALEQALAWPRPFHRNGSGAAIYAWAMRDPSAATWALRSIEDPELEDFMEGRMIAGFTHGPYKQDASEYIASLPEGPRRFSYIAMLAWELSKQGPEAVMRWAEAVPDDLPRYKAAVFLNASSTLAAADPPGTARWLANHLSRDYSSGTMRVVARSWASSDPAAALQWLIQQTAGERRNGSIKNAFRVWLDASPDDAASWLRSTTPEPALDSALRLMVGRTRQESPVGAIDWALAIDDPQLRQEVVANVVHDWMSRDAAAAQDWLAQSDLSQEMLDAIRDQRAAVDASASALP
jgi:hypothetical protein